MFRDVMRSATWGSISIICPKRAWHIRKLFVPGALRWPSTIARTWPDGCGLGACTVNASAAASLSPGVRAS